MASGSASSSSSLSTAVGLSKEACTCFEQDWHSKGAGSLIWNSAFSSIKSNNFTDWLNNTKANITPSTRYQTHPITSYVSNLQEFFNVFYGEHSNRLRCFSDLLSRAVFFLGEENLTQLINDVKNKIPPLNFIKWLKEGGTLQIAYHHPDIFFNLLSAIKKHFYPSDENGFKNFLKHQYCIPHTNYNSLIFCYPNNLMPSGCNILMYIAYITKIETHIAKHFFGYFNENYSDIFNELLSQQDLNGENVLMWASNPCELIILLETLSPVKLNKLFQQKNNNGKNFLMLCASRRIFSYFNSLIDRLVLKHSPMLKTLLSEKDKDGHDVLWHLASQFFIESIKNKELHDLLQVFFIQNENTLGESLKDIFREVCTPSIKSTPLIIKEDRSITQILGTPFFAVLIDFFAEKYPQKFLAQIKKIENIGAPGLFSSPESLASVLRTLAFQYSICGVTQHIEQWENLITNQRDTQIFQVLASEYVNTTNNFGFFFGRNRHYTTVVKEILDKNLTLEKTFDTLLQKVAKELCNKKEMPNREGDLFSILCVIAKRLSPPAPASTAATTAVASAHDISGEKNTSVAMRPISNSLPR